jgi:hypothetical protein
MIVELTPETYFEHVKQEGPLHVVMHYGATCGPCKRTMPTYSSVEEHFLEYNVTNVKFYRFHQWEHTHKEFINNNNLKVAGVPTFKYFYMGDLMKEDTRSYDDPNELKQNIMEVVAGIESTMGGFDLHAS